MPTTSSYPANNKDTKRNRDAKLVGHVNDAYGRIPPHDIELEEVVLGAMMLEQGAEIDVLNILSKDSFYKEANSKIFEAILQLSTAQQPIDIYTVVEQLSKNGNLEDVGGAYYVASLTEKVGSAAHLEFHARILQQKYIQRQLIKISTEIEDRAYDKTSDVNDLLQFSEKSIFDLANGNIKTQTQDIYLTEKCVIPENTTALADYSFFGARKIKQIVLPNSVRSVGEFAFRRAVLGSITLPATIESIGQAAFRTRTVVRYFPGCKVVLDWLDENVHMNRAQIGG